jgi:PAS domain S-box-containing protein
MSGDDRRTEQERRIEALEQRIDRLREREARYRTVVESAQDYIFMIDAAGCVIEVNEIGARMLGRSAAEIRGRHLDALFPPEIAEFQLASVAQVFETGEPLNREAMTRFPDGERLLDTWLIPFFSEAGAVKAVIGTSRDITQRRRHEDEMHRVAKLESTGVLAGGIAHDFNNILTVALGNISLARRRTAGDAMLTHQLDQAADALQRARSLTTQLLTFSKGGAPIKQLTASRALIEESATFALSGSASRAELAIPEELWPIEVDAGQISQVIQNLVLNADQAMPDGGTVRIAAANLEVDAGAPLPLKPGRYVRISVADDGVGIPAEIRERVFDPYFTTKEHGTGLGLSTTHSIVRRHGGHISLDSRAGAGSTFHVHLPARAEAIPELPDSDQPQSPLTGRVLVMDDDPLIRELALQLLGELGFEANLASNGDEAAATYRELSARGQRPDAVIMDLTVGGGVGGRQGTELIKEFDPDAWVIVSSGYSNDPVMSDFRRHGFSDVLTKPYGIEQLRRVLARLRS